MTNPRMQLAEAKITLRELEQEAETIKAIAETEIIAETNGDYGKNEADRKRYLTVALAHDGNYGNALAELSEAQATVDRLTAELAIFDDERKARQLNVLDRQAAALERFADALGRVPPAVAAAACGVDTTEWFGR
jgi:hypothetical protein